MQEKICLKRTGNTGHFMESERNLYEYSNSFRHHTSGICTTGSECLRSGLSHHWIKSAIPHRTLKNIQLTTSHRGRLPCGIVVTLSSKFQLTTSHRGRLHRCYVCLQWGWHFNSLPHTEVDRILRSWRRYENYFNSLPHTEVDGICSLLHRCRIQFQLTTSHRGRPFVVQNVVTFRHFNSLPHTEVDTTGFISRDQFRISTHYLTQR